MNFRQGKAMLVLVFSLLRYFLLFLLYLFIFSLIRDLRGHLLAMAGNRRPMEEERLPGAMLRVVQSSCLPPGRIVPIGRELTIGRHRQNDLVLNDPAVSQRHARIFRREGQYYLTDLRSKNGTLVNEQRIEYPVALARDDRIRIGNNIFIFARWTHEMESGDGNRPGTS